MRSLLHLIIPLSYIHFTLARNPYYYSLSLDNPPLAHPDHRYSWVLPGVTRDDASVSKDPAIYSVASLPPWASFDASSRSISGDPSITDIGSTRVIVTASFHNQSQTPIKSTFALIVSDAIPPHVTSSINFQLNGTSEYRPVISSAKELPNGQGVQVHPQWSFSIGLQPVCSSASNIGVVYYSARLVNGSPLPSWLIFSSSQFTFDGVAPKHNQSLEIALSCSAIENASDVDAGSFILQVGSPSNSTLGTIPLPPLNTTATNHVRYSISTESLLGHSRGLRAQDVDLSKFPWLSWDRTVDVLEGDTPLSFPGKPSSINVTFSNHSNSTIVGHIPINFTPYPFPSLFLPNISTSTDLESSINLSDILSGQPFARFSNISVTFDPLDAQDYLGYDAATKTLFGKTPKNVDYIRVTLTATDTVADISASAYFYLNASPHASSTGGSDENTGTSHSTLSRASMIGLFTAVGITFLALCNLAIYIWWRKRRSNAKEAEAEARVEEALERKRRESFGTFVTSSGEIFDIARQGSEGSRNDRPTSSGSGASTISSNQPVLDHFRPTTSSGESLKSSISKPILPYASDPVPRKPTPAQSNPATHPRSDFPQRPGAPEPLSPPAIASKPLPGRPPRDERTSNRPLAPGSSDLYVFDHNEEVRMIAKEFTPELQSPTSSSSSMSPRNRAAIHDAIHYGSFGRRPFGVSPETPQSVPRRRSDFDPARRSQRSSFDIYSIFESPTRHGPYRTPSRSMTSSARSRRNKVALSASAPSIKIHREGDEEGELFYVPGHPDENELEEEDDEFDFDDFDDIDFAETSSYHRATLVPIHEVLRSYIVDRDSRAPLTPISNTPTSRVAVAHEYFPGVGRPTPPTKHKHKYKSSTPNRANDLFDIDYAQNTSSQAATALFPEKTIRLIPDSSPASLSPDSISTSRKASREPGRAL